VSTFCRAGPPALFRQAAWCEAERALPVGISESGFGEYRMRCEGIGVHRGDVDPACLLFFGDRTQSR
jgi:hypothetical protein